MKEYPTRKILTVFLASPGDVAEERLMAREVADKVNRRLAARLGWHVDLRGWEDQSPAFGRPQALINRESVESCDLFIGLLWKRWGQPTGEFSSGFEEEYTIARERRLSTGAPEISLFFKTIDETLLTDPGPQLSRVLQFKQTLIAAKELLFVEVSSAADWRNRLEDVLTRSVLDAAESARMQNPDKSPSKAEITGGEDLTADSEQGPALRQLQEVSAYVKEFVANNGVRVVGDRDSFLGIRTYLLAASWMAQQTQELLGSHQQNLIYLHRADFEFTPDERRLLVRSLFADEETVIPGWYWLRDATADNAKSLLFLFGSTQNHGLAVQVGAIRLLTNGAFVPEPGWMRGAVVAAPHYESPLVRAAWAEYLGATGTEKDIPLLDALQGDKTNMVRDAATSARLRLLCRVAPDQAVKVLTDQDKMSDVEAFLSQLEPSASSIQICVLEAALGASEDSVRAFALRELLARGHFSSEQVERFLLDKSGLVSEVAAIWMVDNRFTVDLSLVEEHFGHSARIVGELLSHVSVEELKDKIDFFSSLGPGAYGVLAKLHFHTLAERIRGDLSTRFESLKQESISRLKSRLGDHAQIVIEAFDRVDETIRLKFIAAAISGLAVNASSDAVDIGRQWLSHSDSGVQRAAVELLGRCGDATDVDGLLFVASTASGDVQVNAARSALNLAGDKGVLVTKLLGTDDRRLVGLALGFLVDMNAGNERAALVEYLRSDSSAVRLAALGYLIKHCSDKELEATLSEYVKNETYFYDVVCWLDRILYAPPSLRLRGRNYLDAVISPRPTGRLLLERLLRLAAHALRTA